MPNDKEMCLCFEKPIFFNFSKNCFFEGNDFTELGRYEYALVSLENHPPILGSKN